VCFEEPHNGLPARLVIRFAVDGDLRFISHHDTIRLFERALARAAIPVKFSEGFNPRPRLSLPLPRAVGVASDDETLVVECEGAQPLSAVTPEAVLDRLRPQMPPGVTLREAQWLPRGRPPAPSRVRYRIDLDDETAESLAGRVAELAVAERIEVTRTDHKTGQRRRIDLRPCLQACVLNGRRLEWTQALLSSGTARPGEILEALGLNSSRWLHRICRTSVEFAVAPPPSAVPLTPTADADELAAVPS
jgi:radical SAM-linked protein